MSIAKQACWITFSTWNIFTHSSSQRKSIYKQMVNQYKKRFAMTMLYMTLSYFQQYSLGFLKEIIYLEEM